MTDLTQFLRDRYTEARKAEEEKRVTIPSPFDGHQIEWRYEDGETTLLVNDHPYPIEKYTEIATEPAPDQSTLDDLDAKLAIVDEHPAATGYDGDNVNGSVCRTCGEINRDGELTGDPYPCRTLRLLARPFREHPDFDAAWLDD